MSCQNKQEALPKDKLIDNQLWSVDRLAQYLDVPVATIRDWCYKRKIPFVKAGRSVRFKFSDVEKWLAIRGNNGHHEG
jgi:excisionase family DNA binding protein